MALGLLTTLPISIRHHVVLFRLTAIGDEHECGVVVVRVLESVPVIRLCRHLHDVWWHAPQGFVVNVDVHGGDAKVVRPWWGCKRDMAANDANQPT